MSSYEGLRQRSFSSRTTTVPTALERSGDFSQTFAGANNPVLIFDPFTTRASGTGFVRDAFPGNVIPANRQDPVGRRIAQFYPQPNTQGAPFTNANNYYNQGSSALDIDQIDGRVDHNFTSSQRFFVRYSYRIKTASRRFCGRKSSKPPKQQTTSAIACITAWWITPGRQAPAP